MFWIILSVVLLFAAMVISIAHLLKGGEVSLSGWGEFFIVLLFILGTVGLLIFTEKLTSERENFVSFINDSIYQTTVDVCKLTELQKAEMLVAHVKDNEWLAKAQFAKKKNGIFSFYPNGVLDVSPIPEIEGLKIGYTCP